MEGVHIEILEWFEQGCEFNQGIGLLGQVNRNQFYIANIARAKNQKALEYELGKVLIKAGLVKKVPEKGKGQRVKRREDKDFKDLKGNKDSKDGPATDPPNPQKGGEKSPTHKPDPPTPQGGGRAGAHRPVVIREEFPFLADKSCPQELKVLVADMISAHARYVEGHNKLFEVANKGNEACFAAAQQTVENYLENRMIWKELEHYKKTGKILGEHPIFNRKRKQAMYELLTTKELLNKRKNLERQIKYRQDQIKASTNSKEMQRYRAEIRDIKEEIAMVKKLIQNGR